MKRLLMISCFCLMFSVPAMAQPLSYTPDAGRNVVLQRYADENGLTRQTAVEKILDDRLDFLRSTQESRRQALIEQNTEKCLSRGKEFLVKRDGTGRKIGICQQ